MSRGRKPEPTVLRRLKGNPGKRPIPGGEPKPAPTMPIAPDFLGELALEEWNRVAGELHRIGIVTGVDTTILAAYCTLYQQWREALQAVKTLVVQTPSGRKAPHPQVTIMHTTLGLMYKYMQDLGLTPSARVKLATGVPTEGDTLDQFITAGKRKGKAA